MSSTRVNPSPEQRRKYIAVGRCGNCGGELDKRYQKHKYTNCQKCRRAFKRWRNKQIKDNKCICGRKIYSDKSRCKYCLFNLRTKLRNRPKTSKLCQKCQKTLPKGRRKFCKDCSKLKRRYDTQKCARKNRKNKYCQLCQKRLRTTGRVKTKTKVPRRIKYCEECSKLSREQKRSLAKKCTGCGKKKTKADGRYKLCRACREKRNVGRRIREARKLKIAESQKNSD